MGLVYNWKVSKSKDLDIVLSSTLFCIHNFHCKKWDKWDYEGFPDSSVGKESACNAGEGIGYPLQYLWVSLVVQLVKNLPEMRENGFDPWLGKIPWRRERLPTPVFWPREFHGLCSPWGYKESDTTEQLSLTHFFLLNLHLWQPRPCIHSPSSNQESVSTHAWCWGERLKDIAEPGVSVILPWSWSDYLTLWKLSWIKNEK